MSASSAGRICENDYSLDIESRVDTATTEHPFQRPQRIRNPPNRLIEELGRCTNEESGKKGSAEMALFAKIPETEVVPKSYQEAKLHKHWREAIEETINSLASNDT